MDWEKLPVLEQVSGVIRALQTSMMAVFVKIVGNVNLKTLTIFPFFLDAWVGSQCIFAD